MAKTTWLSLAFLLAIAAQSPSAEPTPPLTEAEFHQLHRALQPAADEAWRQLPWHTSILPAVKAAAGENKPLYMLVRSGHPLGCV